jgi:hypothetical protein
MVRMAGDDRPARDDAAHPKDLAELPAGAEDELELALVEPEDLERAREPDRGGLTQLRQLLGRRRAAG